MGVFQRFLNIFRAKANKLLDRVEDPRDTLDLSYEKQLENLQKIRRSVAEVATARKRIEIQATQLQQQAAKLQDQARQALGQGREDLAREALTRRAAIGAGAHRARDPARPDRRPGGEAGRDRPAPPGPGRHLPDPQGDPEGDLHRGRGPDPDRRGGGRASRRRWATPGMTIQRAQDKIATMQARAGAIDELLASGALDRPELEHRRHPGPAGQGGGHVPGRRRAGRPEDRAGGRPALAGARRRRRRRPRRPDGRPTRRRPGAGPTAAPDLPDATDTTRGDSLMAINRRIPADHGLTFRMFLTGLFIVLLYAAVIGILFAVALKLGVIVVIAVAVACSASTGSRTRSPCSACTATSSPPSRSPSCTGSSTGCAPWPT